MTGYRDTKASGAHVVSVDRLLLSFGADATLWNPSPEQIVAMTATPLRCARFVRVDQTAAKPQRWEPAPPSAASVTNPGIPDEARHDAPVPLEKLS